MPTWWDWPGSRACCHKGLQGAVATPAYFQAAAQTVLCQKAWALMHHATPHLDSFSLLPQTQQIAAGLQHQVLDGWCRFRDVTICPISALVDLSLMEFGSPGSVTEASLCRHVVRAPNSPGSQRLASGTLSKHMRKALEDAGEPLLGSHWASAC